MHAHTCTHTHTHFYTCAVFSFLLSWSSFACLLNQILLGFIVSCNFCWSWLGSSINSCRSHVFVLSEQDNIACDSEVVQLLFIYADILWVFKFISQCETEDILWIMIACLSVACFLPVLNIFFLLNVFSFYTTNYNDKCEQWQQKTGRNVHLISQI